MNVQLLQQVKVELALQKFCSSTQPIRHSRSQIRLDICVVVLQRFVDLGVQVVISS